MRAPTPPSGYSNWNLSADRANSARTVLEESGLREHQILEVRGFADRKLKVPEKPLDYSNRRVSILVTPSAYQRPRAAGIDKRRPQPVASNPDCRNPASTAGPAAGHRRENGAETMNISGNALDDLLVSDSLDPRCRGRRCSRPRRGLDISPCLDLQEAAENSPRRRRPDLVICQCGPHPECPGTCRVDQRRRGWPRATVPLAFR